MDELKTFLKELLLLQKKYPNMTSRLESIVEQIKAQISEDTKRAKLPPIKLPTTMTVIDSSGRASQDNMEADEALDANELKKILRLQQKGYKFKWFAIENELIDEWEDDNDRYHTGVYDKLRSKGSAGGWPEYRFFGTKEALKKMIFQYFDDNSGDLSYMENMIKPLKEALNINEDWGKGPKVKKLDKYGKKQMPLAKLRSRRAKLKALKKRTPSQSTELKRINFAIRSRTHDKEGHWGKVDK